MIKNHSFLLMSTKFLQKCYIILFSISNIIEAFYNSKNPGEFFKKWNSLKANKCLENSAFNLHNFEHFLVHESFLLSQLLNRNDYKPFLDYLQRQESIELVIKNTNIVIIFFLFFVKAFFFKVRIALCDI